MPSQPMASRSVIGRASSSLRAAALAAATLLAACAMPTHPDSAAPADNPFDPAATQLVDDTRWVLSHWQTAGGQARDVAPGGERSRPTLILSTATGRRNASGYTGCNRFAGPYTLEGGKLRFGTLAVTRMACKDRARAELEQAYLNALAHSEKTGLQWRMPRTLRIVTRDGATLTFEPADR